jgi:hypothetical protein
MIAFDNRRTPLPHEIVPGERATVAVHIQAPMEPGEYVAQLDVVQEYVAWFGGKGLACPLVRFVVV